MTEEVLSQTEIDQLLTAISPTEFVEEDDAPTTPRRRIKIYDFKRPDKFSKEQVRTVRIIHETFARLAITTLSANLRSVVQMRVYSVDQLSYEEFIRSIPSPTTMAIVQLDPLKGSAIIEIDPNIAFAIIDRSFGGGGTGQNYNRELTDIENSVIEFVLVSLLANMREAWGQVVTLRPRFRQLETNPQFAQVVPPTEMALLVTIETRINETEGMINLCLPYITLEPIASRLSAQQWYSISRGNESAENISNIHNEIKNVNIGLKAVIGNTSITVRETLKLKVGDHICLPYAPANKPIELYVGDKPKFLGMPGRIGRKIGLHIVKQTGNIDDDLIRELAQNEGNK